MAKVNAKEGKVKIQDLVPRNRAERRRIAKQEVADYPLTEAELIQFNIIAERVNVIQEQMRQAQLALSDLIGTAVAKRGLDPKRYGVNLAAGKILPVETSQQGGGNGQTPAM